MQNYRTFILVHGAWHAAWCWEYIARALALKGHKVLTPNLPGRQINVNNRNNIGMQDYILYLIELIKEQSEQVTLVGHSMAGLIISEVAEAIPETIRELIFVAAYIPQGEQSLFSIAQASESNNLTPYLIINEDYQTICLKCTENLVNVFFNQCSLVEAQTALSKIQPEPLKPLIESVKVGQHFAKLAKRALVCRYDQALLLSDQLRMSKIVTDRIIYLDADHAAYYSGTNQIIDALLQ
ncbi:acetoin dehydrogenase E2 subunit dihydrolipoyllysine-residue acetyltransferase [Legionella busanensis]|uniref:Acetoin dehydrogenase E2 subunit dihydrolipoyllysine-residue acetyltransferase n=1 Tax=Legionella busanensis TaxID=190655 RepID=A0A378JKJ4_9GAMM|nr:alpha/beta fold hydrolase [Legionella busanensis]STX50739.1 acetoin dehydrogenase E2 subunit dihydrolipoyllysine-residue acetyltransferase [Legionella busanensis]